MKASWIRIGFVSSGFIFISAQALAYYAPTASMLFPKNLATVSGQIQIQGAAVAIPPARKIVQGQFRIDGKLVGSAMAHEPPYSLSYDTRQLSNGEHTFRVEVVDDLGQVGHSNSSYVTVKNVSSYPPSGHMIYPANLATISGSIQLQGTGTAIYPATRIVQGQFILDGKTFGPALSGGSSYALTLDTRQLANGEHRISIRVTDDLGGIGSSNSSYVTVKNTSDTQAPTVSITSPAQGAIVSANGKFSVSATDNVGVTRVQYVLDDVSFGGELASPFAYVVDTTHLDNGLHTLKAVARDAAGNQATSQAVTFAIWNGSKLYPPSGSMSYPKNLDTISGAITLSGSGFAPNSGVKIVQGQFMVDGKNVGSPIMSAPPYSLAYDTRVLANGSHTFAIRVTDSLGQKDLSNLSYVTVRNSSSSPSPSPTATSSPAPSPTPTQTAIPTPSPTATYSPSPGTIDSGYSAVSPHWPHIRIMYTDFYYGWTDTERDWAAAHVDQVMSGNRAAWKSRNPGVRQIPYRLHWSVIQPDHTTDKDYSKLVNWYADPTENRAGYVLENAFLHYAAGTQFRDFANATTDQQDQFYSVFKLYQQRSINPATGKAYTMNDALAVLPLVTAKGDGSARERKQGLIWDSWRFVYNPKDPGLRAYHLKQIRDTVTVGSDGYASDGVFYDEYGTGGMGMAWVSKEIATAADYQAAAVDELLKQRAAFPKAIIMPNTAEYMRDFDAKVADAAGAVHMERTNNPMSGDLRLTWEWIEQRLSAGTMVEFVSLYSWQDRTPSSFVAGNSPTPMLRMKTAELASYYMVRPNDPSRFFLDMSNNWRSPLSQNWLKAVEANIGNPTEDRHIMQTGTDAAGYSVRVYVRDYDRALVLFRTKVGYSTQTFGDNTAVSVNLPAGETWYVLHADGTLSSSPVTSIQLRNVEAAILIKGSKR